MKFGKNIIYVSEMSNPEWSEFWIGEFLIIIIIIVIFSIIAIIIMTNTTIDYKTLKKKIKAIVEAIRFRKGIR